MHSYTMQWNGITYTGIRPTKKAAESARVEKLQALRAREPKRRTVAVRAA